MTHGTNYAYRHAHPGDPGVVPRADGGLGCRCPACRLGWNERRRLKEHGPNGRRARAKARLLAERPANAT